MEEKITSQDLLAWLILIRSPGLSPPKVYKLLHIFETPKQIIEAENSLLRDSGLNPKTIDYFRDPDWISIEADLDWLSKPDNKLVCFTDDQYPLLLGNIPDPPIGLFISGNPATLKNPQIAVIGTRKPTSGGKRIAREFASMLAGHGFTITSGLAIGIDTSAHEGALTSGKTTIAVLANGLDMIYPKSNTSLVERICEDGAIVSEFPIGTNPLPGNFPRRNRIISGLSVGTLVIEAATRSGSLITAGLALEQGREVFAVPGYINNPVTAGCHALIRNGAKLTTNIGDILEEIGPLCSLVQECELGNKKPDTTNERLDEEHKLLLDNIGYEPITIDQLVDITGIHVQVLTGLLLDLELNGLIDTLPGGRFTKI